MIKYPVKIGFCNELDGTYPVIDSNAEDVAICNTKYLANIIVASLNAMNEFPFPHINKFWKIVNWYYKFIKKGV